MPMNKDELIILSTTMLVPALWALSNFMLLNTNYYKPFLIGNTIILVTGLFVINLFHQKIFGHDEYGLGIFFGCVTYVIVQVIISFVMALAVYLIKIRNK